MKDIKPLGDRILVKILEEEEQVRDGIIIPDSAKKKSQRLKLLLAWQDSDGNRQEFDVSVGDKSSSASMVVPRSS